MKRNDNEAAGNYLRKAVELDPRNAKSYYLLGMIYALEADNRKSADEYRLAEKALRNSLKYDPGLLKARILLASVYLALGDKKMAGVEAEAVLRLTSDPAIVSQARSVLNAAGTSP